MDVPHPHKLLDFSGQVVIVTGAGRGIGAGIALRFAEAGASVVVHYRSSAGKAEAVVGQIQEMGCQAITVQADLTQKDEVDGLISKSIDTFGKLDVLINNAGIYPSSSVLEMSEAEWDVVLDSNIKSVFLCTQAAVVQMISQKSGGAIINIASVEGDHPAYNHSHYSASKSAVVMYTKSSALELGPHGIRVNAVSPGLIWRSGIEEAWPDGVSRWEKSAPLTRLGKPEDVADACLFLASPAARWVTGVNLKVDGGITASPIF